VRIAKKLDVTDGIAAEQNAASHDADAFRTLAVAIPTIEIFNGAHQV
jgi:hypothetical protein